MLFPARLLIDNRYVTAREAEVLLYCAHGLTTTAIAEQLIVSTKTIERHKENIRERFNLRGYHCIRSFAIQHQNELEKWMIGQSKPA